MPPPGAEPTSARARHQSLSPSSRANTSPPRHRANSLCASPTSTSLPDIIRCSLNDGVSYVVRTRSDAKLIAVRLSCIVRRETPEEGQVFDAEYPSVKIQKIKGFLHQFEKRVSSRASSLP